LVSFLDNEGLKYYDERLKAWVEAKVEKSSSASDKKIEELDNKVKTEVAQDVKLDLTEDYVLTVKLYSEEGTLISDDSVDLPIESLVKNGYYDEDKKEIVLELQDGTKIEIPVGDLVENKLDKTSTKNAVYANDTDGNPTMLKQSATSAERYTLVLRNAGGAIVTAYGSEDNEAVTVRQLQDSSDILQDFINKKLNKATEKNKLYGTQEDGYQYLYSINKNVDAHSVAQRTEFGTIKASYPRENDDVATQESVLAGLDKKLNRVNKESDYLSVYAVTDNGKDAFLKQKSDKAQAWSIPLRFRQGQILAARSDIETDPEKLKDSEGNPIDTDNFLVTQGQLKEVNTKVDNRLLKTKSTYILYGTTGKDAEGNTIQSELPFRSTAAGNSITQRTAEGRIKAVAGADLNDVVVVSQLKDIEDDLDLISTDINDATNIYYPNKEDKEAFNIARNNISGSNSIVGSKGFKITQDNFHNACLGLFVIKPAVQDTLSDISLVKTMVCERYGSSQTLTVIDSNAYVDGANEYVTFLTQEPPYLYSEDAYSFSQITFKNEAGDTIGTLQPPKDQAADLIQWYGCVYQEGQLEPSTSLSAYVELQGNYYMPKADNIGAFYYVDIPNDVITQNLVNEPTCIKIDANFDSGTRQSYKDWGDDGTLTTVIAEQCLKANYTVGNSYLTLFLKKNKREGQGLEQAPIFKTSSCIRFTDYPEIGNATVGLGFNNIFGDTDRGLFDFGFASGYGNTSIGRYSITGGTRNSAVYAGVALGNHNIVLGQSGFAAGATNFISRSGSNGIALGSENVLNGKNNVAGGRANNVGGLYSVALGYGNKVKGNNGIALGYNNNQSDDLEFAVGLGNTLTGEGSITLGRANQACGNYNVCIGRGNIANLSTFNIVIGQNNNSYGNHSLTVGVDNKNYMRASIVAGFGNRINNDNPLSSDGAGHLVGGNNNTLDTGRNNILSGQTCHIKLRDSLVVGNNLQDLSGGYGKAIFGNYNDDTSYASLVLGNGTKDPVTNVVTRRNAFEVHSDGRVITPTSPAYLDSHTKRLTTKEYVDNKIATELAAAKAAYEEVFTIDLYKQENGYYSESKVDDIKAAYEEGKVLKVHEIDETDEVLPLMYITVEDDKISARFGYSYVAAGGESVITVSLDYSSEDEGWHKEISEGDYFRLNKNPSDNSLVAAGNLNMGSYGISNIGELHVNGEASIFVGSTVKSEAGTTNKPRLTGVVNEVAAAFVQSDTQNTYIPLYIGNPTKPKHAVNKEHLDAIISEFIAEEDNGKTLKLVSDTASDTVLKLDCEGVRCTNTTTQEDTVSFKWNGVSPYTIGITETYDSSTETSTYTTNSPFSFDAIKEAFNNARPLQVFLTQTDTNNKSLLPLMSADFNGNNAILVFGHSYVQHDGLVVHSSAIEYIHNEGQADQWLDISASSESLTKSAFNFDESTGTLTIDLD